MKAKITPLETDAGPLALLEIGPLDAWGVLAVYVTKEDALEIGRVCAEWAGGDGAAALDELEAATEALIDAVDSVNGVVSDITDYKRCAAAQERARKALAAVRS